jgi:hypothetical protein
MTGYQGALVDRQRAGYLLFTSLLGMRTAFVEDTAGWKIDGGRYFTLESDMTRILSIKSRDGT